jgi:hypothetical protein
MSCSCVLCSAIKHPARQTPGNVRGGVEGGGGGVNVPSVTIDDVAPDRGLNKSQRLTQERNEEVREDIVPRLNPPFPYRVIAPPLDYFRIPANPPETLVDDSS